MRAEWYEQMSRPECKQNGIIIYIYIYSYIIINGIFVYMYLYIYIEIFIYIYACIGRCVCNTSCMTQQPLKSKQMLRYMRRSCIYTYIYIYVKRS